MGVNEVVGEPLLSGVLQEAAHKLRKVLWDDCLVIGEVACGGVDHSGSFCQRHHLGIVVVVVSGENVYVYASLAQFLGNLADVHVHPACIFTP